MTHDKTEHEDDTAGERVDLTARPSDAEIADIEAERTRRLDPANRPENAEVDNTDLVMVDERLVPRED